MYIGKLRGSAFSPSWVGAWVLWHLTSGLAVGLIPSQLRTERAAWALPGPESGLVIGIVLAHWAIAAILGFRARRAQTITLFEAAVAFIGIYGSFALGLVLSESYSSRTILSGSVALSAVFFGVSLLLNPLGQIIATFVLATALSAFQAAGSRPSVWLKRTLGVYPKPHASRSIVDSHLYSLNLLAFQHYFDECPAEGAPCASPGTGGGLAKFGSGYLLATGEGVLHYFVIDSSVGALSSKKLKAAVPINSSEYVSAVGVNVLNTFRVTDLVVRANAGKAEIYATHHFWKTGGMCGVLRLSRLIVDQARLVAHAAEETKWETIYETTPCLPATGGHLTRGSESGGRMVFLDQGRLLLTVGDHEYDGLSRTPIAAQDPSIAYGKTLVVDIESGRATVYSLGHRNPQGLFIDDTGIIWSTEHGPKGGDEINILQKGRNYGWPIVTHGTQYGAHAWPLNPQQGQHLNFEPPVFSWVPSIAVSQIVRIRGGAFPLWRGDLLIGSFTKALHRVRLHGGRVVNTESIPIHGRIRHILEEIDGKILMYLDAGTLVQISPIEEPYGTSSYGSDKNIPKALRGQYLFASCAGCHKRKDGAAHGIGPDLANVLGRPVGSATGFAYSKALAARGGRWDASTLDAFLSNPRQFAPGTAMALDGLSDPADRAALIQYLAEPVR